MVMWRPMKATGAVLFTSSTGRARGDKDLVVGRVSLGRARDGGDVNRSLSDSAKAILMRAFATSERTGVS
jgi:hypothetical protein